VDPRALVSAPRETYEARRAMLMARATAEREALAREFAPLGALDSGLERLRALKAQLPAIAMGTGLGLSALLLALPAGRTPLVRGGIALLHLAGSVRRLFSRR
jgi:hypothetical protein